jgi:hypothetical protein
LLLLLHDLLLSRMLHRLLRLLLGDLVRVRKCALLLDLLLLKAAELLLRSSLLGKTAKLLLL